LKIMMTKSVLVGTLAILLATSGAAQDRTFPLKIDANRLFSLKIVPAVPTKLVQRGAKIPARTVTAQAKLNNASITFLVSSVNDTPARDLSAHARQLVLSSFPGQIPSSADGDIEALAFIVLMQATKDMDEDLKEIMTSVKEINKERENLRKQQSALREKVSKNKKATRDENVLRPIKRSDFKTISTKHDLAKLPVLGPPSKLPDDLNSMPPLKIESLLLDAKQDLDTLDQMSEEQSLRLQMLMDRRSKFIETLSNIMKKLSDTSSSIISNLK
jgi:hypothetical protein